MRRQWETLTDLARLLETRAKRADRVTVTAETARLIASKLRTADTKPARDAVALSICRRKESERCGEPCFECMGRANIVVRLYGESIERIGTMRLVLDLPDDMAKSIRGLAKVRGLAPEQMAAELLRTHMESVGLLDGAIHGRPLTRFSDTEGSS